MNGEFTEKLYSTSPYSKCYDLFFGSVLEAGRELAIDALDILPGDQVLEIGFGTALMAPYYPTHCRVTGIDLSDKMLFKARDRIHQLNLPNFQLSQMDGTRLAFGDGTFDRVLAAYFLSVVRDPLAAIDEMKRVCRKGGCILFINHFLSNNKALAGLERLISPLSRCIGFHTDVSCEELLRHSGLQLDRVIPVPPTGLWRAVRCINR